MDIVSEASRKATCVTPNGSRIGLRREYNGVPVFEQPSPSGGIFAAYGILEYNSTPTEQEESTAQDDHETSDYMDADGHPAQPAGSFTNNGASMDQDLPYETTTDDGDTGYSKWLNFVDLSIAHMSQSINEPAGTSMHAVLSQWIKIISEARDSPKGESDVQTTTNQVYEPEDFIPLG